ncbi:MAG: OmpH family outer membrane protein [Balneolaceae bacterium]|nr:OmpH family outer membrane protein [Balneolaceae bacterium]MCH8547266.1 OmpH family outer membrane protein [Balneolaceae bacterium]
MRRALSYTMSAALAISLSVLPASSDAQNQKIGFIDSEVIMEQMPEYSGIEQRLSLMSENWRREIAEIENEIEELERDFEAREVLFTDEVREQRINEINNKRDQLERFIEEKFGPRGEYFELQKELLEPIQRQIFDALERVAERDQFDFVFDRAQDSRFLIANSQWNLTDDVMLEMGMDPGSN